MYCGVVLKMIKFINITSGFDIQLEVINSESKEILANTKLTIKVNGGVYEIKKQKYYFQINTVIKHILNNKNNIINRWR